MKPCLAALGLFLCAPFLSFGQKKEYVELQRDIALLQDQVRTLQRSVDEKNAQVTILLQQALDSINKANTSIALLENNVRERLREQEKTVAQPVANVGAKVDQLTTEFQAVKESMADLAARFGKLEQQLVDVSNAVKTLQAPPQPPGGSPAAGPGGGPPAGVSAESLYRNALRDKDGGNADLALKGFQDYLQYFPNTEYAPNAQFYIGETYYRKGEYPSAVKAFDDVLEQYPANNKTPDAHYMKGTALLKMGQRNKARDEFYLLIRKYPSSELAAKAKSQLKGLGLPVTPPRGRK